MSFLVHEGDFFLDCSEIVLVSHKWLEHRQRAADMAIGTFASSLMRNGSFPPNLQKHQSRRIQFHHMPNTTQPKRKHQYSHTLSKGNQLYTLYNTMNLNSQDAGSLISSRVPKPGLRFRILFQTKSKDNRSLECDSLLGTHRRSREWNSRRLSW